MTRSDFDAGLLTPQYLANPYPYYAQIRETDPVHWNDQLNAWVLTRYNDVHVALREPRLISGKRVDSYTSTLSFEHLREIQPLYDQIRLWIGNLDPPDHTRLRALVNKAFTPRIIEQQRPQIEHLVHELLDAVTDQGRMDFIGDFSYPLPAIVIADMLGVPRGDRNRFMKWSDDLTRYSGTGQAQPDVASTAARSANELTHFFKTIADQRRAQPGEDLISSLVQIEDQGDRLSEPELLAMCGFLIVAGHETTMALLGNGMLALLRHPDQMHQLRDDPSLTESAVEELLRYDSPIQHQTRVAVESMELIGQRIDQGQRVMPFLGAANRDPDQFPQPDHLELARDPNRHLAFGYGIHFCLGAPLARLEAQIAFPILLERLPGMHLIEANPPFRPHTSNRNPVRLPLAWDS